MAGSGGLQPAARGKPRPDRVQALCAAWDLEGIVSKRTDAPYRRGQSRTWLKSKNPADEAVRRESEEEWR